MIEDKVRKLASSCRTLADRLTNGVGPTLHTGKCYSGGHPCCAFGHALDGAGFKTSCSILFNYEAFNGYLNIDGFDNLSKHMSPEPFQKLMRANDQVSDSKRDNSVIQPLKDLADYLDSLSDIQELSNE